jgi:hypothetical protein
MQQEQVTDEREQRTACVMLFDAGGDVGPVLEGTWELGPWGMHDECYVVRLHGTGQSVHVWLEGVTERPWPPQQPRLVLDSTGCVLGE